MNDAHGAVMETPIQEWEQWQRMLTAIHEAGQAGCSRSLGYAVPIRDNQIGWCAGGTRSVPPI